MNSEESISTITLDELRAMITLQLNKHFLVDPAEGRTSRLRTAGLPGPRARLDELDVRGARRPRHATRSCLISAKAQPLVAP